MAAAPEFKVYNAFGDYVAAVKEPEAGAAIIAGIGGEGWTIRYGHRDVVWTEGAETNPASESYDEVAMLCWTRRNAMHAAMLARVQARDRFTRDAEEQHARGLHIDAPAPDCRICDDTRNRTV